MNREDAMKPPRLPLTLALAAALLTGTAIPAAHFGVGIAKAADKKAEKTAAETNDPEMAVLAGQSYYLQKQFKPAADDLHKAMTMAAAKGTVPKEDWLQVLMSAEFEQQNTKGVEGALEQLVQNYPKP